MWKTQKSLLFFYACWSIKYFKKIHMFQSNFKLVYLPQKKTYTRITRNSHNRTKQQSEKQKSGSPAMFSSQTIREDFWFNYSESFKAVEPYPEIFTIMIGCRSVRFDPIPGNSCRTLMWWRWESVGEIFVPRHKATSSPRLGGKLYWHCGPERWSYQLSTPRSKLIKEDSHKGPKERYYAEESYSMRGTWKGFRTRFTIMLYFIRFFFY